MKDANELMRQLKMDFNWALTTAIHACQDEATRGRLADMLAGNSIACDKCTIIPKLMFEQNGLMGDLVDMKGTPK